MWDDKDYSLIAEMQSHIFSSNDTEVRIEKN